MFHDVFIFTATPPTSFSWVGEPLGVASDGNTYYSSFKKNGETFKNNDFVLVQDNGHQSIFKIIDLIQTKSKALKLYGLWFYTWDNVEKSGGTFFSYSEKLNRRKHTLKIGVEKSPKELFVSFETVFVNPETVIEKCYVRHLKHRELHEHVEWLKKRQNFFYCLGKVSVAMVDFLTMQDLTNRV